MAETLQQVRQRIDGDIRDSLEQVSSSPISTNVCTRRILTILGNVFAGAHFLTLQLINSIRDQIFPQTADEANLLRHANYRGVPRNEATTSMYTIALTGINGTVVPASTEFATQLLTYVSASEVIINTQGEASVIIESELTGSVTNLSIGDVLTIVSPIAGLNNSATVATIIREANNQESIVSWRSRIVEQIQLVRQGGSVDEYSFWARQVAGVTRAFVFRQNTGPGTVGVMIVTDDSTPPIPTRAKILEVFSALTANNRPAIAEILVFAPTLIEVRYTIEILSTQDTQSNRDAIDEQLSLFWKNFGSQNQTVSNSQWIQALSGISTVSIVANSILDSVTTENITQLVIPSKHIAYYDPTMTTFL